MIKAVEDWAAEKGCTDEMFYQIGDGAPPAQGAWVRQLAPDEFERRCREAQLIVSHAGTGILMVASSLRKKVLVFPRRFSEPGEIRNDHQMDTARRWVKNRAATVAFDVDQLHACLNTPEQIIVPQTESPEAKELIEAVRSFVHTGTLPPPRKA
jgi:UDP-N-acetylglucosamine transferase subunit ALG13